MKLGWNHDFLCQMIGVLVPDKTVNFPGIDEKFGHNRIKGKAIGCITTESDISMPGSRCRGRAVLLFSHVADVRFLRGFWEIRNESRRVKPVSAGEVKDEIIGRNGYSRELRIGGVWSFGHGGFPRKHHVQRLLEYGRRTEQVFKYLDGIVVSFQGLSS